MDKDLYTNTKYNFDRDSSKNIILDISITPDNTFTKTLYEKLIIDKESEIYLDTITTYNCNSSNGTNSDNMGFIIRINEFDIKSCSNEGIINRSIFIPNEQDETTPLNISKSHKGKKLNFISSINPCVISNISGKITNMVGDSAFTGNGRCILEFIIVSK